MSYWSSQSLRGNSFEEMVSLTNELYRSRGLGIVQKIPTPITPVRVSLSCTIELAYFEKKSTVEYMGVIQGVAIAFDAKETSRKNLPLDNIHQHQIDFMRQFEEQRGIAFLLVRFSINNTMFFLPFDRLLVFWESALAGGRKSIPITYFDDELAITRDGRAFVHYLEALDNYLYKKQNVRGLE